MTASLATVFLVQAYFSFSIFLSISSIDLTIMLHHVDIPPPQKKRTKKKKQPSTAETVLMQRTASHRRVKDVILVHFLHPINFPLPPLLFNICFPLQLGVMKRDFLLRRFPCHRILVIIQTSK